MASAKKQLSKDFVKTYIKFTCLKEFFIMSNRKPAWDNYKEKAAMKIMRQDEEKGGLVQKVD